MCCDMCLWNQFFFFLMKIMEPGSCATSTFLGLLRRAGPWSLPLVSYPWLQQLWSHSRSAHALTTIWLFLSHLCYLAPWFSIPSEPETCAAWAAKTGEVFQLPLEWCLQAAAAETSRHSPGAELSRKYTEEWSFSPDGCFLSCNHFPV